MFENVSSVCVCVCVCVCVFTKKKKKNGSNCRYCPRIRVKDYIGKTPKKLMVKNSY